MASKIPKSMPFRICIYPCDDKKGVFIAHCLDLDVISDDTSVEGAVTELLKVIETQIELCETHKAQVFFPAPGRIWQKYTSAKKAGRKLPEELIKRIVRNANKRLGHQAPHLDDVLPSIDVPDEFFAVAR